MRQRREPRWLHAARIGPEAVSTSAMLILVRGLLSQALMPAVVALEQPLWARRRDGKSDLAAMIQHTDAWSQYLSTAFTEGLEAAGAGGRAGRAGRTA